MMAQWPAFPNFADYVIFENAGLVEGSDIVPRSQNSSFWPCAAQVYRAYFEKTLFTKNFAKPNFTKNLSIEARRLKKMLSALIKASIYLMPIKGHQNAKGGMKTSILYQNWRSNPPTQNSLTFFLYQP